MGLILVLEWQWPRLDGVLLPSRRSEVNSTQPEVAVARDTDMNSCNSLIGSPPTNSDFRPWMLVTRRRGRVRGRGTGLRAAHMTYDVVATKNAALLGPSAGSAGRTRGGRRGRGCGDGASSRAFHVDYVNTDEVPINELPIENPCGVTSAENLSSHSPVSPCGGVRGSARSGSLGSHTSHAEFQSLHRDSPAFEPVRSNPIHVTSVGNDGVPPSFPNALPSHSPWVKSINLVSTLPIMIDSVLNPSSLNSPPLVVRTSLSTPPSLLPSCPSHQQVVYSVSTALAGDPMADSGGSDEEWFRDDDDDDDEDDEMSEEDDVDNSMTLDQF